MYFLTQFKFKKDDSVDKGTSNFETLDEAIIQFHVAIASAMQKEDTSKFVSVILDSNGTLVKREVYNKPIQDVEPQSEQI